MGPQNCGIKCGRHRRFASKVLGVATCLGLRGQSSRGAKSWSNRGSRGSAAEAVHVSHNFSLALGKNNRSSTKKTKLCFQWFDCGARAGSRISLCRTGSPELVDLAAHALGWAVIAGSWFRSVPQIVRILRARSAEGISVTGTAVETMCYTVIVGYNLNKAYPFSTYGDVFACWLQDIVVAALIVFHMRPPIWAGVLLALVFAVSNWWIISGTCGAYILLVLQVCVGFAMSLGARVPQIVLNIRRGNTGELSLMTSGLSCAGNIVRLFTTIVLTSDVILLIGTGIQSLLNGVLTWQCLQTEVARRQALVGGRPTASDDALHEQNAT